MGPRRPVPHAPSHLLAVKRDVLRIGRALLAGRCDRPGRPELILVEDRSPRRHAGRIRRDHAEVEWIHPDDFFDHRLFVRVRLDGVEVARVRVPHDVQQGLADGPGDPAIPAGAVVVAQGLEELGEVDGVAVDVRGQVNAFEMLVLPVLVEILEVEERRLPLHARPPVAVYDQQSVVVGVIRGEPAVHVALERLGPVQRHVEIRGHAVRVPGRGRDPIRVLAVADSVGPDEVGEHAVLFGVVAPRGQEVAGIHRVAQPAGLAHLVAGPVRDHVGEPAARPAPFGNAPPLHAAFAHPEQVLAHDAPSPVPVELGHRLVGHEVGHVVEQPRVVAVDLVLERVRKSGYAGQGRFGLLRPRARGQIHAHVFRLPRADRQFPAERRGAGPRHREIAARRLDAQGV